ncbi:hypothetical protein Hypma_007108 [Hypsizygus marmoreus]|uniref:Uncharacterized protein n=1 Tax=Hypsizygus marmoreus TaxID=39966 RepID=A0A369KHQ1_HYPMA|nr:hypothetical protein Hypma_007108 [Hypsizygus marmoreus]
MRQREPKRAGFSGVVEQDAVERYEGAVDILCRTLCVKRCEPMFILPVTAFHLYCYPPPNRYCFIGVP